MKKLNFLNKFIYVVNMGFAIALLLGFIAPLISPSTAPKIAVLSLTVPVLIITNIVFILYWLLGFKRQFLLSVTILIIGYFLSSPLYNISKSNIKTSNEISIMSYNVRLFNTYKWIKDDSIPSKIVAFVTKENPDILCIQEYHPSATTHLEKIYPYKYIKSSSKKSKIGQAIYSKFHIVNEGALDFKHSVNNAIFVDVVKGLDTLRIYNLHLESLGLNVDKENFGQKNSEKLIQRLGNEFKKQQTQVIQVNEHKKNTKHPIIICGDFNNTAYSWVYKNLKTNLKDSFNEAGNGFGKTFDIKSFPMRIDFILSSKYLSINKHKNYTVSYSDHSPIMAIIGL